MKRAYTLLLTSGVLSTSYDRIILRNRREGNPSNVLDALMVERIMLTKASETFFFDVSTLLSE
jgi:hypothetical protein